MLNILRNSLLKNSNSNRTENDEEVRSIIENISESKLKIECLEKRFDLETEPELIDACAYEIVAVKTRYNHLLKKAKEKGIRGYLINPGRARGEDNLDRDD